MHPVRGGDSPPQQTGNAWSPSSVVLGVPGYITLTGRQLLSLLRMQMTHYLVQSPILPIISSMSFYPNIQTIHITLDQGRTHSFKLSVQHGDRNFIDRMLFREASSVYVWMLSLRYFIHLTAVGLGLFVLFCTLYFMLLCFLFFFHNLFTAAFCHL